MDDQKNLTEHLMSVQVLTQKEAEDLTENTQGAFLAVLFLVVMISIGSILMKFISELIAQCQNLTSKINNLRYEHRRMSEFIDNDLNEKINTLDARIKILEKIVR